MAASKRKRHRQNELKFAMRDFLVGHGQPASIAEIKAGVVDVVGERPASSYRSSLQDETMFERVERGIYRVR